MFVGIDDTDSLMGGCTTYLAAVLLEKLGTTYKENIEETGKPPKKWVHHQYPRLIRLNPNTPYRTRGNGAVAFHTPDENIGDIQESVLKSVEEHSHLKDRNTNPGVIFLRDHSKMPLLKKFYQKTVSELVSIKYAEKTAEKADADIYKFNDGRGIIGALAAVGADLSGDKTFELLAYRVKENYGRKKEIDEESVFRMDEATSPETFHNIDPETKKILITPHGHDPVYCGIRGETAEAVKKAWDLIKPLEEIERTQVFVSNQATDAHLREKKISCIKPYDCVIAEGLVKEEPWAIKGGHVFFTLVDGDSAIDCAAYEPTGDLRATVRELVAGDRVKAYGGVGRYRKTINMEKLEILELKEKTRVTAPLCCNRRMSSAGKDRGYKCRRCGRRAGEEAAVEEKINRKIRGGLYEVPPRARRHLSKPLQRMFRE